MADIFISYSHADGERVEAIVAAFESSGFSVWYDKQLAAGVRFSERLAAELDIAKAVVVAWSEHSAKSHWVADEAGIARDTGRLLPVRLDDAPLPLGFRQFQAIKFEKWRGDPNDTAFLALAEAARASIEGRAPAPATAAVHPAAVAKNARYARVSNRGRGHSCCDRRSWFDICRHSTAGYWQ